MAFTDLRQFLQRLESTGRLRRVADPVDPDLESTAFCRRALLEGGPALLFERPVGASMPVLANLFGTPQRVAYGMGAGSVSALRDIGELLAHGMNAFNRILYLNGLLPTNF